jgi:hypothetical protein
MELKWVWDSSGSELRLTTPGTRHRYGFIEAIETETSKWNGANTLTYEYKRTYRVHIAQALSGEKLDCEHAEYVTLRKAMRALKETVTVLLIGRSYGT